MALLPLSRLKSSFRVFTRTAVDFGGPFITVQGREKRYLCLFTCLATQAVHLEIAFGLDTDSFLNAFYRMASRRGLPEEIYSDNGTNFKGADNELKSLVLQIDENKIQESVAHKGVKWHFNPPFAPHFGGVHESMIKSAKWAIKAILGNTDINEEELMTAVIGADGLINSRPLTYQSANPADDVPLTPNHFLHGQVGGPVSLRQHWWTQRSLIFGNDGAGSKNLSGISGSNGSGNGCRGLDRERSGNRNAGIHRLVRSFSWSHQIRLEGAGHWEEFWRYFREQMDEFESLRSKSGREPY